MLLLFAAALRGTWSAPRWALVAPRRARSPPGGLGRPQEGSLPRPTFMGRVPCLLELPLALGVATALLFSPSLSLCCFSPHPDAMLAQVIW